MTCTEESKEHIEYTFHAFCKVVIRNARYTALRDWSRTRNMVFRRRKSGNGTGAAAAPPATISANPYTNDKHPKQIYSCKTYNAYGNSSAAQNSGESRSPSAGRKSGAPIFTAAPGAILPSQPPFPSPIPPPRDPSSPAPSAIPSCPPPSPRRFGAFGGSGSADSSRSRSRCPILSGIRRKSVPAPRAGVSS